MDGPRFTPTHTRRQLLHGAALISAKTDGTAQHSTLACMHEQRRHSVDVASGTRQISLFLLVLKLVTDHRHGMDGGWEGMDAGYATAGREGDLIHEPG